MLDENGRTLFTTGHMLHVGDEFISEEDTRYQITRVDQDTATAKAVGQMDALPLLPMLSAQTQTSGGKVAIYHTHSSESYEPSDGSDSRPGAGGILEVGASMASSLERQGVDCVHSTTSHEPHDAAATIVHEDRRYFSRNVQWHFDVYRDAGPLTYLKELDGRKYRP